MFLELVRCLATDDAENEPSEIGDVIKVLIGRISEDQVDSSLGHCLGLYKQENSRAVAAQVNCQ